VVLVVEESLEEFQEVRVAVAITKKELPRSQEVLELELEDASHAILHSLDGINGEPLATSSDGFSDGSLGMCFGVVFGCPPRPMFKCETRNGLVEVNTAHITVGGPSVRSDPTHDKQSAGVRIHQNRARIIRPPHDAACRSFCKHHFEGQCRKGYLCNQCHDPSHYTGRSRPPAHRARH